MIDPHYENVSLLLPMNGADGGTTFTDYSPNRKSVTVYGNTHTETDQSKYYGSSGYFDGSGDYLRRETIVFGSTPCCIEAWVRLNAMPTSDSWSSWSSHFVIAGVGSSNTADGYGLVLGASNIKVNNADTILASAAHGMTTGVWYHVACSFDGSYVRTFVDGIKKGETSKTGTLGAGAFFFVGTEAGDGAWFNGYIQDLRVTKGVARYTSNFTPPAKLCGTISGAVTGADGNPAQRTIIAVPRTYPTNQVWSAQSSAVDGSYSLTVPDGEYSRIVLADETTLYNHVIDRVIPG